MKVSIEIKMMDLFQVIVQEAKQNQEFADKISRILNGNGTKVAEKNRARSKRNPAPFNPEKVLEIKGETELFHLLENLDVDSLKDIVSEFGMDPAKKVMRWRKKEKYIEHIVQVAQNRLKKGNAFR